MLDEVAWKCSAAFVLGAAAHYVARSYLFPSLDVAKSSGSSEPAADDAGSSSSEEEEEDWDEQNWTPHKMVLCVRTDLKMGKGGLRAAVSGSDFVLYKVFTVLG